MSLRGFYLLPHPPIVIPEVGKVEVEKIKETSKSLHDIGAEIARMTPNTIILVTPHGTMFEDAVALAYEDEIYGDLKRFGVSDVTMQLPINMPLTSRIAELADENGISVVKASNSLLKKYDSALFLDHGAMVPLYFINKYYDSYKLVHITYASFSDMDLYNLGIMINKAVQELSEDAIIIASGDLSHRLKEDGPYGFNKFGEKFDTEFIQNLQKGYVEGVLNIDEEIVGNAGECGRRSVVILLGTLEGKEFNGELLSYEDTFGVGYGVMKFNIISESSLKLNILEGKPRATFEERIKSNDPYVMLARESINAYLKRGVELSELPDYVTEEMRNTSRGVFVSMKKNGNLRGCIGTIFPLTNSIAEEIVRNAIAAGFQDPRFYEVDEEELEDIVFSVDVLTEPETARFEDLDPKEYGVIVRSNGRTGLLLPDLEGVNTVEEQLNIALDKAGIGRDEEYTIQKFRVIRHREI